MNHRLHIAAGAGQGLTQIFGHGPIENLERNGRGDHTSGMNLGIRTLVAVGLVFFAATAAEGAAGVSTMRTPEGGIQPQVAVDDAGTVHLIFYKGDERGGNVFYARQRVSEKGFSKAIQVNSQPGSAIAMGTIRGPQIAVGRNGRVHVAWNGGEGAAKVKVRGEEATPMVYTRLNDAGTGFEPERNVLTQATGLDGGGSVAADAQGNVYVVWHGRGPNAAEGEAGRAVFVARSSDDGKSFAAESVAWPKGTGVCGCCGLKAFAGADGALYILFRAVNEMVERDEVLLVSPKPGAAFELVNSDPWKVSGCPMSSASFSQGAGKIVGAWETAGQIAGAILDGKSKRIATKIAPSGTGVGKRRQPVAAANGKGELLLAWTEGTAWAKGGSVAWQLFDGNGKAMGEPARAEGVPVWSLVAAYAKPSGEFVVIY